MDELAGWLRAAFMAAISGFVFALWGKYKANFPGIWYIAGTNTYLWGPVD